MLRHELTHLRRHDLACKLFLRLACVVHWFNPLVWWMSREAGRNLELCCDGDVVRGRDSAFRRTYGEILLKTAAGAGRAPALSARMGVGKGHLKARLTNLFVKKKSGAALVCAVLAAVMLGGSLVSCTGEAPDKQTPGPDSSPAPTVTAPPDVQNLKETMEELTKWKAVAASVVDIQEDGAELEQIEELIRELEASLRSWDGAQLSRAALQVLADSVQVTRFGEVSFTLPDGYGSPEDWTIEFRGRVEFEGLGGASLHIPFSEPGLKAGVRYTYDFFDDWANITDLFLWAELNGEGMDINLLELAQDGVGGIVPPEMGDDGLSEYWYVWEKPGFGGNFGIHLEASGAFSYCVGMLSSYIGMGTWTWDGEILCLEDTGMGDPDYYYFKRDGAGNLVFQAERSARFMHVDVEDGDLFYQKPIKPALANPGGAG